MMRRDWKELGGSKDGAVAPTVALTLFALVACGGLAFDVARVQSMDTELQNAADQAALAAASQLDGQDGACARAAAAASALVANSTLLANDGGDTDVVVPNEGGCDASGQVRFYQDKDKTQPADDDENAKFVEVEADPREAFYAFTPIVAAFSSGDVSAEAFAGIGEAICRVPPLMMCNPNEAADPDFNVADYVGKGIRLVANDGGGGYGPGVFGFLEVGQGNGAADLRRALGRNGQPGNCVEGTGVDIEPGNMVAVRDALNTRFDIYDGGLNNACGGNGSLCPASANSRKDLLKGVGGGANSCGFQPGNGNVGWKEVEAARAYLPPSNAPLADPDTLAPMGYPRDICHAVSITGACAGATEAQRRIGDGIWDRNAYFRSHRNLNYPGGLTPAQIQGIFGTPTPTRYQVYRYEMENAATRLQTEDLSGNRRAFGAPVCQSPGLTPSETQIDRRTLSVAVLNCNAEDVGSNSEEVPVVKWIDIFLIEPSVARARTENSDVYVEVIGETANATDNNAIQVVRKAVPYLIE